MKKMTLITLIIVGMLSFAAVASADSITISDITDGWRSYTPSGMYVTNNVSINNGKDTEDRIWWGQYKSSSFFSTTYKDYTTFSTDGPSSYVWNSNGTVSNPNITAQVDNPFQLGLFTHNNNPVYNKSLESVYLDLGFKVTIDGSYTTLNYSILFENEDTTNTAGTCIYYSETPCADKVTISAPFNSDFKLGTIGNDEDGYTEYYFSLLGFKKSENEYTYTWEYITQENKSNSAYLYAVITSQSYSACEYNPDNPICSEVINQGGGITDTPEPASILLLGTGIIGLGLMARRRLGKK